ncbi:uncharacterized protein LOC108466376 [Gossypium arboreum]|uniref:uncharacterized protein LOC108466376 n=1 Tax=Gossypium arboreum TaxID=29729 RepID=UPI000819042E|nr:uncharacterized protein LOC108466376 [Gossypium arboreum]
MASSGFSAVAPLVFNGEGFHIWVVKMRSYLQAFDLWEAVNTDAEPAPLRANPIMAQIRQHADERTKRHKAMSCIQNCVSDAWDKLKEEFQGTERTRQQQLLNLRRDFEILKMKEEETVKQYSDRIMAVVNSIRLLGEQFSEARIVEKVLLTLPKRYESKGEPVGWRSTRRVLSKPRSKQPRAPQPIKARRTREAGLSLILQEEETKSVDIVKGLKKGHVERVCKEKGRPGQNQAQHKNEKARVAEDSSDHEEQVFAVSCLAGQSKGPKEWFLDNRCTNHMSPDAIIFKILDTSCKTKVKIGNEQFIKVEGK